VAAAEAAGRELLSLWPSVLADGDFGTKSSDTDPVTRADTAAQEVIAGRLCVAFPHDGLVGEEELRRSGSSGWQWVIDPLDGTVNFLYGRDDWAAAGGTGRRRAGDGAGRDRVLLQQCWAFMSGGGACAAAAAGRGHPAERVGGAGPGGGRRRGAGRVLRG
jgi:fructose-1,6-bisphosphatase/inositol monophosphatase family enzyme